MVGLQPDTAAWPEKLCHLLAKLAVEAICNSPPAGALANGVCGGDDGEGRASLPQSREDPANARFPQSDPSTTPDPEGHIQGEVAGRHASLREAPRRRKVTQAELDALAKGGKLEDGVLYVGRGGRGVPPSKWGGTLSR